MTKNQIVARLTRMRAQLNELTAECGNHGKQHLYDALQTRSANEANAASACTSCGMLLLGAERLLSMAAHALELDPAETTRQATPPDRR